MTAPVSEPPMVHLSPSARLDHRQSVLPTRLTGPPLSSPTQPITLGRQIYEAYNYRTRSSHEYKDTESMSDETSAKWSRRGSDQDNFYHNAVHSPTFAPAPQMEAGARHSYNSQYLAPNAIRGSQSTSVHSPRNIIHSDAPMFYMPHGPEDDVEGDHAIWILVWLSLLDPIYSLVGAVYALLTVIVVVLLTPLRLCDSAASPSKWTIQLLSPIHAKHLGLIFAQVDDLSEYKAEMLVVVYLLAPLMSFGVAITAWVSASFWIFTLIMGNPDGTERGDDGRNAVLYVRDKWALFLNKAFR